MTISETLITFGYCLFMTIIIEVLIALIFKVKEKLDIIYIVLVQILTNPLLVGIELYIRTMVNPKTEQIIVWIMEIIVVFVEGFIYSKVLKYKKVNPYVFSFILNGLSYGIGFFISEYLLGGLL